MTTTIGYPGKKSAEEARKEQTPRTTEVPTMNRNKPQETNNHPTELTTSNKFEPLRHAETEGDTRRERQDPAAETNSYN
jgi:hypothetical protein